MLSEIAYPGIHNVASPKNRSYLTSTLSLITHLSKSVNHYARKNNSVSSGPSFRSISHWLFNRIHISPFSGSKNTNQRTRLRHIAISSVATLDTGSIRLLSSTCDFLDSCSHTRTFDIILFFLLGNFFNPKGTGMNFSWGGHGFIFPQVLRAKVDIFNWLLGH